MRISILSIAAIVLFSLAGVSHAQDSVYIKIKSNVNGVITGNDNLPAPHDDEDLVLSFHNDFKKPDSGGNVTYDPIRIVKKVSLTSISLRRALNNNESLEVRISFYRPDPTNPGAEQLYYRIVLGTSRAVEITPWYTDDLNNQPLHHELLALNFVTITWEDPMTGSSHMYEYSPQL